MPAGQIYGENDVSQLVWIRVTDEQAVDKTYRLESGFLDWKTLRQEKAGISFGWSGNYLGYKRYPLDMPLPTFKIVAGLLRLLKLASSSRLDDSAQFSRGAAFSFAMGSSIPGGNDFETGPVGRGNGFGIGTLGKSLYLDSIYECIYPSDAHEHLERSQWTIVLIHEAFDAMSQERLDERQRGKSIRAVKRLRYALVTPTIKPNPSDRDLVVADIPTSLQHMMGKTEDEGKKGDFQKPIEVWNSRIAAMDTVDFYWDEDIHDILPKVLLDQKIASSGS